VEVVREISVARGRPLLKQVFDVRAGRMEGSRIQTDPRLYSHYTKRLWRQEEEFSRLCAGI